MKKLFIILVGTFILSMSTKIYSIENRNLKGLNVDKSIYGFVVKDIDGKEIYLSSYKGKVLLIVNVASKCGYTPQYEGLQKIYEKYSDKGFEILAFPCNDFKGQEPGTNEEIKEFCSTNYGVTFKLFDKIKVLGDEKSLLYDKMINSEGIEQGDVKWNFEKFLISKEGIVVGRFRSKVKPDSDEIIEALEKELNN
jgi:glutathione peroxidase